MKTYGDIPQDHEDLIKELGVLLDYLILNKDALPHLAYSKCMTSVAHDYFAMDMEEEGEKYLKFAADHSPGYFMAPVLCEMEKDPIFTHLISDLKENPFALKAMIGLGFEYE
jgi:hypothetical protein